MKRAAAVALAIATSVLAPACEREKATAPIPRPSEAPLVPREALFGDAAAADVRLSPAGDMISYVGLLAGRPNLFVAPIGDLRSARPVTADRERGVTRHFWAANGAYLLYLADQNGDERWRLHAVEVATGADRDLTPVDGVSAELIGQSREMGDWVLVGLNDRDKVWRDVYRINVRTGERALVQKNEERFGSFMADQAGLVRLATRTKADGAVELFAFQNQGGWKLLFEIPFEDSISTRPIGFDADGKSFLMYDTMGRDKAALVRVSLATGVKEVLGESERADVSDVWLHPTTHAVEAFASEYLKTEWTGVTPEAREDIKALNQGLQGESKVIGRSADDALWLVLENAPAKSRRVWVYRRAERKLTPLLDERPALAGAPLQTMIPVEIASSDGQTLVSYLTLPPQSDKDGDGTPDKPVPLVLSIHDGPWARDSYGFSAEHQWLANRGYAALSVNFRGSTGFGRTFVNLGNKEWGAGMDRDLLDAVKWAVDHGVTSPGKIGLMGRGYGGYAVLASLAFNPGTYACGISFAGPTNLEALMQNLPARWETRRNDLLLRVGDPRTTEGKALLSERSPTAKLPESRAPLLLGDGVNDTAARKDVEALVETLRTRGQKVTFLRFADEGRTLLRAENRKAFYAVAETFLQQCLGGRVEPIGKDFDGARLQAPVGADFIGGLTATLARMTPKIEAGQQSPSSAAK